jgi:hypothetical protein
MSQSRRGAFSQAALDYFLAHAINPEIARVLGVTEADGELVYPYSDHHANPYVRRRPLHGDRTFQPKGKKLVPWTPCGVDGVALICEGESDLLAVASVLYDVVDLADEDDSEEEDLILDRRRDLPPPLADIVPVALPGAGAAHKEIAQIHRAVHADSR